MQGEAYQEWKKNARELCAGKYILYGLWLFSKCTIAREEEKKEMNRMNLEQMSKRRVKRVVNDLTLKRVKTNERGSQLTWWISIST